MIQEIFAMGSSPIHRMDPRLKIVAATVFSVQTAISHSFSTLIAALFIAVCMVVFARLKFMLVFKRLLIVNGFIFFLWLILPLTFPGDALFSVGPLNYTFSGVVLCTKITLKSNAILLSLIALTGTSHLATLGYALNRLKVPDKIIYLLLITYRYLFVIEQEYQRLIRAARVRCFEPGTNLHTYRTYAYLIAMLFVRASARAERVYHAMLCRGFDGKFHTLRQFSFTKSDLLWSITWSGGLMFMGYLEWVKTTLF